MTVVYRINRIPSRILGGKCPFELVFNKAPSLDHLRVFGCLCYAANLKKRDKFSARAIHAVFLGYSLTRKGYKLFDLSNRIVFVSRDVIFQEDNFPFMQMSSGSSSVVLSTHQNHHVSITNIDAYPVSTTFPNDDSAFDTMPIDSPLPDIQEDILLNNPIDDSHTPTIVDSSTLPTANSTTPAHSPSPQYEDNFEPHRSSRISRPPIWMQDYVSSQKSAYPISNSVSYLQLKPH